VTITSSAGLDLPLFKNGAGESRNQDKTYAKAFQLNITNPAGSPASSVVRWRADDYDVTTADPLVSNPVVLVDADGTYSARLFDSGRPGRNAP